MQIWKISYTFHADAMHALPPPLAKCHHFRAPSQRPSRWKIHLVCSAAAGADNDPKDATAPTDKQQGPIAWIKNAFGGGRVDKAKLAEYGLGAFAAYGILSNLNAGVLVTIAWLAVVKQTGQTPVDPGNWPIFLGIYAGLYLTTNLLRPVRLTLALTVAPFFNKGLERIQNTLRVNKAVAFGIMLACIAITSFTGIMSAIIVCGGFPNGVPQLPWKR